MVTGGVILILGSLLLVFDKQHQRWLLAVVIEFFGIEGSTIDMFETYIRSVPFCSILGGCLVIVGGVVWWLRPPRPKSGAELVLVAGKFIASFGATLCTLPIAVIIFGIFGTIVLVGSGIEGSSILLTIPHLVILISGLVLVCLGSLRDPKRY